MSISHPRLDNLRLALTRAEQEAEEALDEACEDEVSPAECVEEAESIDEALDLVREAQTTIEQVNELTS